ncbi:hypothetical protein L6452_03435 [Arctium lappa]|uniref:Uncharacterized protein n=1 Tax=Arctium lappa TaxID=4217 RepID=A0ACB9FLL5_ARCLA|nr:hypothetical protein L6452_03435 [Arctium lappa]
MNPFQASSNNLDRMRRASRHIHFQGEEDAEKKRFAPDDLTSASASLKPDPYPEYLSKTGAEDVFAGINESLSALVIQTLLPIHSKQSLHQKGKGNGKGKGNE